MLAESHISHAIATFSELGIATASLLIVDAAKWRERVNAGSADPVERENWLVQARKLGWLYTLFTQIAISSVKLIKYGQYLLPFISFFLGFITLLGISFYPLTTSGESLDSTYFGFAVGSFILSIVAAVIEQKQAKVAGRAADQIIDTQIE